MAGDEQGRKPEEGAVREPPADQAPPGDSGPGERDDADSADRPRITLDRYLSQRRGANRSSWPQLVTMVLMLVTLVLIIIYKDRCGTLVSGVMGGFEAPAADASPPVKYRPAPSGSPDDSP